MVAPAHVSDLRRADGGPSRVFIMAPETVVELLRAALRFEGCEVHTSHTGDSDVAVIDASAPGGLETARGLTTPVLMLATDENRRDRVAGAEYVAKPFAAEDVVARVRGLLRRRSIPVRSESMLVVGDLTLDEESREVRRGGVLVALTATEFELLRYLMRNPRRVLSKAQILDRVWRYDFGGRANIVELYISYLRKKIDNGHPRMIHTLRGSGYVLRPAD